MNTLNPIIKATTDNLKRFKVVRLPYGDQNVLKLSVVKSVNVKDKEVTVIKMYEDKNKEQTYKIKSLGLVVDKSVVDSVKFIDTIWNM